MVTDGFRVRARVGGHWQRTKVVRLWALANVAFAAMLQGQVVPIGPQFIISQEPGFENPPALAASEDGSFLVAWRRTLVGSSREPLMARLFDAAGSPLVDEFEITDEGRDQAVAAAGPQGKYLVVWNTPTDIWAQVISPEGEIEGEAVQLTERSPGEVFNEEGLGLAVDFLSDTRAIVAWRTNRVSVDRVEARLLNANGRPRGKKIPVSVPSFEGLLGFFIRGVGVTALADGGFVVVWDRFDLTRKGKNRFPNFGRVFSADGRPVGESFLLDENDRKFAEQPTVADLPQGGFLVAWKRGLFLGRDQGVFTRRFRPSGRATKVRRVTADGLFMAGAPKLAVSRDGLPVVVWHEWQGKKDDDGLDVIARSLTKGGRLRKAHAQLQINTTTTEGQYHPTITATADGSLLVVWEDDPMPGSPRPIVGRFLSGRP